MSDYKGAAKQVLPILDKVGFDLFKDAEELAKEVTRHLNGLERKASSSIGMTLSVRTRRGLWGPRLVWVRLGKPRTKVVGHKAGQPFQKGVKRATTEIAMPDGLSIHMNQFAQIDEPVRTYLRDAETRAREIRRTVKEFRDLYMALNRRASGDPSGQDLEG